VCIRRERFLRGRGSGLEKRGQERPRGFLKQKESVQSLSNFAVNQHDGFFPSKTGATMAIIITKGEGRKTRQAAKNSH